VIDEIELETGMASMQDDEAGPAIGAVHLAD